MEYKRTLKMRWILGLMLIFAALTIQPGKDLLANAQSEMDVASPGEATLESPSTPADAPPDSYTGTHVEILYYDCAIHPTTDCISATRAQLLADQLDEAWDLFMDYGFNEPDAGDGPPLPVWVFSPLVDDALGWARSGHIEVRTDRVQTTATDVHKGTPQHELFHMVQRTYAGGEPAWVGEGTPKFIEDNVFDDGDADAASQYVARVNRYLEKPNLLGWDDTTDTAIAGGLFDTSYNAAIIWKYLTEQFGDTSDPYFGDEPQYGIDFLVDFWEMSVTRNGIDAVNAALPAGINFEDAFQDFLMANYLKRFNVSSKYTYVDDSGPTYAYTNVFVEHGTEVLPLTHNNERVEDWGAIYYVGDPPAICPFIQVRLDGDPGSMAFYAIFATRGNDAFYYDHLGFRTYANDFTKTLYNDAYDRVVAVVGGMQDAADFSISMSCVSPELNIIEPRQDLFAEVGDPDLPHRMMVLLELSGADESFVEGVTWEEFEVSVGGIPVDAVITGAYIQSQYWLIVQPPTQTVSGDPPWMFDLDVSLEGLSDHEDDAVHYRPLPNYDEVLVIDTSDSMSVPIDYPKLLAAQNAAKLYVDELAEDDMMGAVEFNSAAAPVWNGMTPVNDISRGLGKLIIEGLDTEGCTSIGGGLQMALSTFAHPDFPDSPDNTDVIVLLSDGMENTSPCWEYHPEWSCAPEPYHGCSTGPYVRDQVIESGIPVNTVALGPDSDEEMMERIADDTGGLYRYSTLPTGLEEQSIAQPPVVEGLEPPLGEPQAPAQDYEWALNLANIYDFFEGEVEGRERIQVEEMTIPDDFGGWYQTMVFIDQSVSQATFSLTYDQWSLLNGDGECTTVRHVELRAPDNMLYTPTYSDDYHDVFEVSSPMPGNWRVRVEMYYELCGAVEAQAPDSAPYYLQAIVSGQTALATEVRVGTPHEDRFIGLCVPIYVTFLGASGPVDNGNLTATVTTPSGGQIQVLLADDGNQGDGSAEDGIYAGQFCRGSEHGTYTVDISGRIEALAGTIWRLSSAAFYIQDDDDTDGDGLPNHWEVENGLNPETADDTGNPDLDFGCIPPNPCFYYVNSLEYLFGADPNNDDSDGGGEMDASELIWFQDPNSPVDDMVQIPTSFAVVAGNGENVVSYDSRPVDDTYVLFWSTDPLMNDLLNHVVDIGNTGVYTHTGLSNDITYYYLLVAVRALHISGYADQVSATPSLDPIPPQGNVLINNDAPRAASLEVELTFFATEDAVEMLVANSPDFADAAWEPLADTRDWHLSPTPEGTAFVYARFRDETGNVSEIAIDGILAPRMLFMPVIWR